MDSAAQRRPRGVLPVGPPGPRHPVRLVALSGDPILHLAGVGVRREGRWILDAVEWTVRAGERWAVVGPNGSGKTTLLRVASTYLWPSRGRVEVLGETIGRVDARELRRRIGYVSAALMAEIDPALTALDVVVSARQGALAPWWARYGPADRARAQDGLARFGLAGFDARTFGSLSTGERSRVLIARTLMTDPELVLLDEPAAGLDLGAREALLARLADLAASELAGLVLVTHHLEEIPVGFNRALVLADGRVRAGGPIEAVLTGPILSDAFGLNLAVDSRAGRFSARATVTAN
ncbi:MAG: ABC transporter ATP-binding protein [Candidatus Limnocylindrales bacterium]